MYAEQAFPVEEMKHHPKKRPRFFSLAWFKELFSAFKMWKYGSREWMIFNLSSWLTHLQWIVTLGAGKAILSLLPAGFVTAIKSFAAQVVAFVTAVFHMVVN